MRIGRVIGRRIAKNRDGETDVLLLQVEISDPDDIQTVELVTTAGSDFNPPDDSNVIILDLGAAWPVAVAVDDGIVPGTNPGEYEIYSSQGGAKIAKVKLLPDGTIRMENPAGYAELSPAGVWDFNGNLTVLP